MSAPVEIRWLWRRVYAFAFSAANGIFIAAVLWKLSDAQALKWLGLALIASNILMALFYLAGATGTDIAQVIAAARGGAGRRSPTEDPGGDKPEHPT